MSITDDLDSDALISRLAGPLSPPARVAWARTCGRIGMFGLFLTGLIAGIALYALRTALIDRNNG